MFKVIFDSVGRYALNLLFSWFLTFGSVKNVHMIKWFSAHDNKIVDDITSVVITLLEQPIQPQRTTIHRYHHHRMHLGSPQYFARSRRRVYA